VSDSDWKRLGSKNWPTSVAYRHTRELPLGIVGPGRVCMSGTR
jgi:hypothetical protein